MDVKVIVNTPQLIDKIESRTARAQKLLDSEVLKDSNYYCPLDTSNLQKSAILNTVIGSGVVVWRTPYAKAQYYGLPNKNTSRNPNATSKWFEVAKAKKLKFWEALINKV